MPASGKQYIMPSGRRVTVLDVSGGVVTYAIEGLRSLFPLRKPLEEFILMTR